MIKEAIEKLEKMTRAACEVKTLGEVDYSVEKLNPILPMEAKFPETIMVPTLRGIINYSKSVALVEPVSNGMLVVVESPVKASLIGPLLPQYGNVRFCYIAAKFTFMPFPFGEWHDLESMILSMYTLFEKSDDRDKIIEGLSMVSNSDVSEHKDTGVTGRLKRETGIGLTEESKIQNPVVLKPFRTFPEIDQPETRCIFRLRRSKSDGGVAGTLFEADGGMWKIVAIEGVKEWLRTELSSEGIQGVKVI